MTDLRTLAKAATQGEWYACTWDPMERSHVSLTKGDHHGSRDIAQNLTEANAAYIAAVSPAVVLRLLELLRDLADRHEWTPGLGPCICEFHVEARETLRYVA